MKVWCPFVDLYHPRMKVFPKIRAIRHIRGVPFRESLVPFRGSVSSLIESLPKIRAIRQIRGVPFRESLVPFRGL